ncbi:tryptophan synthase subunit alpha [Methanocella sp. MCL-LM]|uniref:tryptophan synthase subunit alpha n=1 Tax=Methanocella sp. MCL-LM TaxID=3412035 RepID=UPI003C718277
MTSRINMKLSEKFAELRRNEEGALVAYITLGDPSPVESLAIAQSLIDSGAVDVLELGVPFSDPIADGPVIQNAVDRALRAGMNTDLAFEISAQLDKKVPIVYLTYYNIVLQYGIKRFFEACQKSGIVGVIIADLPYEEGAEVRQACADNDVDYIHIVTPNTNAERMRMILAESAGFAYLVSTRGVTGKRASLSTGIKEVLDRAKAAAGETPVAVGFGISGPDHVADIISMGADGAIVGSAIVDLIAKGATTEELQAYVRSLKQATRAVKAVVE